MPPPTLGSVQPAPRGPRIAVLVGIALAVIALAVAVYTVPEVGKTWRIVSHQTGKVLDRVLGIAEQKTTEYVGGVGGDAPKP